MAIISPESSTMCVLEISKHACLSLLSEDIELLLPRADLKN